MWPVFLEYSLSVLWSYLVVLLAMWSLAEGLRASGHWAQAFATLMPSGYGLLLGATCLAQFAVAKALDSRYDHGMGKNYYWMVWYPAVYWVINVGTTVVAFPRALWGRKAQRARWISPDRGVKA